MTFFVKENVKYYLIDKNFYTVGDNTTKRCNAFEDLFYSGNVTIYDEINGIKVKEIGVKAFFNCPNIKNVNILANITKIHQASLKQLFYLEYVNIPHSVIYLGKYAIDMGDEDPAKAPLIVEFNGPRTEPIYIDLENFAGQRNHTLIYPYTFSPLFNDQVVVGTSKIFYQSEDVVICAPKVFPFAGKMTTTDQDKCPFRNYEPPPTVRRSVRVSFRRKVYICLFIVNIVLCNSL